MALDFKEILNKKVGEVERPSLIPAGSYQWQITKLPTFDVMSSDKGSWDTVTFPVRCVGAEDDVDPDEVKNFGDITKVISSVRFMIDKEDENSQQRGMFDLRKFLETTLGVIDEEGTIGDGCNNAVNARFIGTIVHVPDGKNKELFHANIRGTAPIK